MRNLNAIKKRISAIQSTQKITNAMRLVSLSKLQQHKKQQDALNPYFIEAARLRRDFKSKYVSEADNGLKNLYIVFAPDLGLVSAYTNGLLRYIKQIEKGDFLWIGTQGYEVAKNNGLRVLNEKTSSEQIELDYFIEEVNGLLKTYVVNLIIPSYGSSMSLEFMTEVLDATLKKQFETIYYPDFVSASIRYNEIVMKAMIYYTYYASKYSEYTTRRIAMETATQNAEDMIDELQLVYNRARQEAITQEISELISGMEA